MKAQGSGIVHNVSPAIGVSGFSGAYGYTASKGAVEALTRTLRLEYAGTGIHFTLLHPPLTDTASAAPLAVRRIYMDRPEAVGRRFAKKARSTRGIIFADVKAWAFDVSAHLAPDLMGRIFASQSEKYSSRNI